MGLQSRSDWANFHPCDGCVYTDGRFPPCPAELRPATLAVIRFGGLRPDELATVAYSRVRTHQW
jgi:hypothetical protein